MAGLVSRQARFKPLVEATSRDNAPDATDIQIRLCDCSEILPGSAVDRIAWRHTFLLATTSAPLRSLWHGPAVTGEGMAELEDYGITKARLQEMYEEFLGGVSKSELERRYLGKPESHGKLFSSLVSRYLGIDTERRSPQTKEIARLQALVRSLGGDPRRTRPQTLRERIEGPANQFYGYGDYSGSELTAHAAEVAEEVVDPLLRAGVAVVVTIEVRAAASQALPDDVVREVAGGAHVVGFKTAVFDSADPQGGS